MASSKLPRYLDNTGRVSVWPAKQADKLLVLQYLAEKFDFNRSYSEQEINVVLKLWHTFADWALLRRSLIDYGFMSRNRDGSDYRREL